MTIKQTESITNDLDRTKVTCAHAGKGRAEGLQRDEQIIRQFFNDGADGNRARRALDRIMAATDAPLLTHDRAEGAGPTKANAIHEEGFIEGVNHTVEVFAKLLKPMDVWNHADDSEDHDTDLANTFLNIMAAKGLYDAETAEFAAPPKPAPNAMRVKLRELVDAVWNDVTESSAVPTTEWADKLINQVFPSAPVPPANGTEHRWLNDLLKAAEAFRVAVIYSRALDKVPQDQFIKQLRALETALNPFNYRPSPAVAAEPVATVTDAQWERALNCAHEIMQRDTVRHSMQGEGPLPTKKILDNAMQHAFGMLSLRKSASSPVRGDREEELADLISDHIAKNPGWDEQSIAQVAILFLSLPVQPNLPLAKAIDLIWVNWQEYWQSRFNLSDPEANRIAFHATAEPILQRLVAVRSGAGEGEAWRAAAACSAVSKILCGEESCTDAGNWLCPQDVEGVDEMIVEIVDTVFALSREGGR